MTIKRRTKIMKTKKLLLFSSLLFIIAISYGCPNVNKPYPERTFFLFELSAPDQTAATIKGATGEVNRFSISPSSDGREFIYRISDLQFRNDFYNQFFRPPDNLITETVRQWLDQAGVFEDLLNPASMALPKYIIEGNIVELYGDYRNESAAKAVMRIQLFLLRTTDDGSNPLILMSKTYASEQSIGAASPNALMNGWNLALEDILGEFLSDLSYHIKQSEMKSSDSDS